MQGHENTHSGADWVDTIRRKGEVVLEYIYPAGAPEYAFSHGDCVFITQHAMDSVDALLDVYEDETTFVEVLEVSDLQPYGLYEVPYPSIIEKIEVHRHGETARASSPDP